MDIGRGGRKQQRGGKDFDDILGDLLSPDDTPKKKPAQQNVPKSSIKGGRRSDEDFYSSLAAQVGNDVESDVSDADVGQMAKALADLDDMDADLFGGNLTRKKGSVKGGSGRSSKQNTPRRTGTPRSRSNTPRSASGGNKLGSPQRVASPTRSDSPTSPPGSARGSLKRRSSKPTSPPPAIPETKPGTAPGKMTNIGRASESLKPGQVTNPEDERPRTVPKAKPKLDFGEFDEDDPLAGLLSDDGESEAQPKPAAKKPALKQQKSVDESSKTHGDTIATDSVGPLGKEPQSPVKRNLMDRPPTRSGSGKSSDGEHLSETSTPKPKPAIKKKDEVIFSDDDEFLDGLGLDDKEKPETKAKVKLDDAENRPAKSIMDSLLGKGSAAKQLESKERREFVLDKKYSQKELQEDKKEDDFLFGSYQPSAASGSRPSSRRSVRFQDDDDIFGLDKPPSRGRSQSPGGIKKPSEDIDWLEQEAGYKQTSTPKSTPVPAVSEEKPVFKQKISASDWLGLKDSDSEEEFFKPKIPSNRTPASKSQFQSKMEASKAEPKPKAESADTTDSWLSGSSRKKTAVTEGKQKISETSPSLTLQGENYLGLGKEIDPDDILMKRPDSPIFKGKSPSVFGQKEDKTEDLFSPPPTRDPGSGSLWNSSTRRGRQAATLDDDIFSTGRRSGFSRQRSMDNDFLMERDQPVFGAGAGAAIATATATGMPVTSQPEQLSDMSTQQHRETPSPQISTPVVERHSMGPQVILLDEIQLTSPQVNLQEQPHIQQQSHVQQQQQQQQLLQQQQLQKMLQDIQRQYNASMQSKAQARQPIPNPGQVPVTSAQFTSVSSRLEELPSTLPEAQAKIRTLEIEKHSVESLLESTKKRFEEEIAAIESSYKNRMQILEDSNHKKEARLREENEQLMEQHLSKVRKMEQEKGELCNQHYRKLEEMEREKAQEMEKIKDQHRLALTGMKREHEESVERIKQAKNLEITAVASAHDTSRSLSAVVEQIQNNAKDLGELQVKVDSWHRMGLDEREISLKSKDEQLRILQERLTRQEADNENERKRLEELIARMENQLRDQTRLLDEERWKIKQDHNRTEALQKSLEDERRSFLEQQTREKASIERARSSFLEEQQSSLTHLNEERRSLAEERTKFNVDQKMIREKMHQDSVKSAQAEAEYAVLMKTIVEERAKSSARMQELHHEEDKIAAERSRMEREKANLDHEKERLSNLALQLKQKSAEVDSMTELAARSQTDGERSLMEARQIESQQNQRLADIQRQIQNIKAMENHIGEEKLKIAKDKKDLENLKNSSLCTNCRTPIRPDGNQSLPVLNGHILPTPSSAALMSPVNHYPLHAGSPGLNFSVNAIETITTSIAADRSIRMWKIQALKDKEYLEEESLFLQALKHSPYHSPQKT